MRLIDADVLKEDLSKFYDGIVTAKELIDSQPTVELLKEKQGISVDAFLQWCIESHRMGDASRKGIEYWINEFKTWKQNRKDEEKQPRKGHWISVTNGRGGNECSVCHNYAPSFQDGSEHLSKFCPDCGADMRKDGDPE